MNKMRISVVIPTYNRYKSLRRCLDSLFNQSYQKDNYEIIVVDDGSTDGTKEMIDSIKTDLKLKYLYQENKGPAAARNLGVKHANGDIIAFIDDDCTADYYWIENIVKFFEDYLNAVACGSHYNEAFILPIKSKKDSRENAIREFYLDNIEHMPQIGNFAVRKQIFRKVGGFDESLVTGEDMDFLIRLLKRNYHVYINDSLKVTHYSSGRLLDIFKKKYIFSLDDFIIQQKLFKNLVLIHFPTFEKLYIFNFPFTIYLRVDMIKIMILLIALSIFYTTIKYLILIIILTYMLYCYSYFRNLETALRYILQKILGELGRLSGSIVGSIGYRVIHI